MGKCCGCTVFKQTSDGQWQTPNSILATRITLYARVHTETDTAAGDFSRSSPTVNDELAGDRPRWSSPSPPLSTAPAACKCRRTGAARRHSIKISSVAPAVRGRWRDGADLWSQRRIRSANRAVRATDHRLHGISERHTHGDHPDTRCAVTHIRTTRPRRRSPTSTLGSGDDRFTLQSP